MHAVDGKARNIDDAAKNCFIGRIYCGGIFWDTKENQHDRVCADRKNGVQCEIQLFTTKLHCSSTLQCSFSWRLISAKHPSILTVLNCSGLLRYSISSIFVFIGKWIYSVIADYLKYLVSIARDLVYLSFLARRSLKLILLVRNHRARLLISNKGNYRNYLIVERRRRRTRATQL